jgi:hypothetical protein
VPLAPKARSAPDEFLSIYSPFNSISDPALQWERVFGPAWRAFPIKSYKWDSNALKKAMSEGVVRTRADGRLYRRPVAGGQQCRALPLLWSSWALRTRDCQ